MAPTPAGTAPVIKKLGAGRPGTRRYQRQFGAALVCVRYRHDPVTCKRYTTVEVIVDERQMPAPTTPKGVTEDETVAVAIGYGETELRARAKQAGTGWDAERKVWFMAYRMAVRLGLHGRVKKLGA